MSSKQKRKAKNSKKEVNEKAVIKDSIGDLLKEYEQSKFENQAKKGKQKNYEDEKYDYLKKELKNSSSQNHKLLLEDEKDVFSFSKKVQKNEPSYYEKDQKNIFFDESQDQSSIFQKKEKMSRNIIEQIEEDSDLFNKDDSQNDDEEEEEVNEDEMFNTKRTVDYMCFEEPSRDDSEMDNQIIMKKEKKEKLNISNQQANLKEILLDDFRDGNFFSFSKEANQSYNFSEKIRYLQSSF